MTPGDISTGAGLNKELLTPNDTDIKSLVNYLRAGQSPKSSKHNRCVNPRKNTALSNFKISNIQPKQQEFSVYGSDPMDSVPFFKKMLI